MDIHYRNPYDWRHHMVWQSCSVENYVSASLEDRESDGATERAQGTASETADALGRLVQLLASRGQLTAAEVAHIAGASTDEVSFNPPHNTP